MVASSIGRMPASLVIILVVATVAALLSGLFLELSSRHKAEQAVFMPQRLESSQAAVAINLKTLQGQWNVSTGDYAMTLTLVGDRFEWIVKFGNIPEAQFYARGNYRVDGDVMILGQRPDLGKPYDPAQPWLKYMPIAMKDLNTKFTIDGKNMMWDVSSSEQERILSHVARIFAADTQGKITWVKR
jgi:hypothetical protein